MHVEEDLYPGRGAAEDRDENLNISIKIRKKSSVTPTSPSKNEIPVVGFVAFEILKSKILIFR